MSSLNETIQCVRCSKSITGNFCHKCSHCLISFCYQCLIKHQHNDIKNEFLDLIKRIDQTLVQFLHHAHNQTEWTNHLTEDRNRLEIFLRHIETYCTSVPIPLLPSFQWVNHVNNLIYKNSFATYENCCQLMYPPINSFIKS